MKLSTRGRYGLKAMVDLALAYGQGVLISTASLAQQQEISEAYLERIIASLRKSGLGNRHKRRSRRLYPVALT